MGTIPYPAEEKEDTAGRVVHSGGVAVRVGFGQVAISGVQVVILEAPGH